jgi:drug/metabolite transporter (DMT)-like permease
VFKTVQGSVSVIISYKCLQSFHVSTVGVVCSLMPLLVCVMAAVVLGERVTAQDYLTMVLIITSVMMVILGAKGQEKETMQTDWIAMTCLIVQPFLLAGGVIAMRKMKKMHAMVVSTYTNLFLALSSYLAMAYYGLSLDYISNLSALSWVMFALIALFTIGEQTTKFMALKYQEASKL